MSGTFTKLSSDIIHSSVWRESLATKITWVTMLAMADQYGRIGASTPGLAAAAGVSIKQVEAALACFLAPDPFSRTADNEGRRIEKIDKGWRLLNYDKHRNERDEEHQRRRNAKNVAAYRERKKASVSGVSGDVSVCHPIADTEAEANTEAELLAAAAARPASVKNAAPASPAEDATASSAAAAASTPQPPSGVASDFTKTFGFSSKAKELIALTKELFSVEQCLDLNPTEVSRLKDIDWGDSVAALRFAASDSYWQQQMRIVEVDEGEDQTSKLPGSEAFKCFIRTYKKALLPQSKKAKKRKIIPEKKASYKAQSCAPTPEGMAAFEVEVN